MGHPRLSFEEGKEKIRKLLDQGHYACKRSLDLFKLDEKRVPAIEQITNRSIRKSLGDHAANMASINKREDIVGSLDITGEVFVFSQQQMKVILKELEYLHRRKDERT